MERSERAAAQGLSVQLKAEADRRAKVFHNAVKAGVAKVQAELEAERDTLEARHAHPAPMLHLPLQAPPILNSPTLICSMCIGHQQSVEYRRTALARGDIAYLQDTKVAAGPGYSSLISIGEHAWCVYQSALTAGPLTPASAAGELRMSSTGQRGSCVCAGYRSCSRL